MRRRIGTCLLAVLMLAALTVTAFAADPGIQIKEEKDKANCVLTPVGTEQKLKVEINNADAQNLVLVTKNEIKSVTDLTADNIVYINQAAASGGKAVFDGKDAIQPSEMKSGDTYYLYRSGTDTARTLVALFSYESGGADIMLGDANGDKQVTPYDASVILQYYVEKDQAQKDKLIDPVTGFACADVNCDKAVTPYDASLVLQYCVLKGAEQETFFELHKAS